ncbi:hypothetical protein Tco_0645485 [Tanacetum coccineum]
MLSMGGLGMPTVTSSDLCYCILLGDRDDEPSDDDTNDDDADDDADDDEEPFEDEDEDEEEEEHLAPT